MKAILVAAVIVALVVPFGHTQEDPAETPLLRGYREILLGTPYDTVQQLLAEDPGFTYRGEPDLSLAPGGEDRVIDTRGRVYLERGLFQFQNGNLYIIALYLDRQRLDYFQLFNQFQNRYGPPDDLDPQRAVWEDEITRIELERPLTVRYLDLMMFEERRQGRRTLEALEDIGREQFLERF